MKITVVFNLIDKGNNPRSVDIDADDIVLEFIPNFGGLWQAYRNDPAGQRHMSHSFNASQVLYIERDISRLVPQPSLNSNPPEPVEVG